MIKYIIFGSVAAVSFVVASVAVSLLVPNREPDRPGDMKQPIERYSPPAKTEQIQTKQDLGGKNKDKGNSPKHEQIEARHDEENDREEEGRPVAETPSQRPASQPPVIQPQPQRGPGNMDSFANYSPPPQRGPGNIDSTYTPVYSNRPVNLGPGNL